MLLYLLKDRETFILFNKNKFLFVYTCNTAQPKLKTNFSQYVTSTATSHSNLENR